MGFEIITIVVIFIVLFSCIYRNRVNKKKSQSELSNCFQNEYRAIISQLEEKRQQIIDQYQLSKEENDKRIAELDQNFAAERQNYCNKIAELEKDYQEQKSIISKNYYDDISKQQTENRKKIEQEQIKFSQSFTALQENYEEKRLLLENDFQNFQTLIEEQKQILQQQIDYYEKTQKEVIAELKANEERRQQQDFYKIELTSDEKDDIIKLKNLSVGFSKPEILLKLIYEIYYKTKLEELFKRILGENKNEGGIYKITNINNQKVYIGKTTNLLSRFRTHAKRGCGLERISGELYNAMYNEGLENFTWEVIGFYEKEELAEKEKYWIGFYKSNEYGYNQRIG